MASRGIHSKDPVSRRTRTMQTSADARRYSVESGTHESLACLKRNGPTTLCSGNAEDAGTTCEAIAVACHRLDSGCGQAMARLGLQAGNRLGLASGDSQFLAAAGERLLNSSVARDEVHDQCAERRLHIHGAEKVGHFIKIVRTPSRALLILQADRVCADVRKPAITSGLEYLLLAADASTSLPSHSGRPVTPWPCNCMKK